MLIVLALSNNVKLMIIYKIIGTKDADRTDSLHRNNKFGKSNNLTFI